MVAQIEISQRLATMFKTRQHVPTVREPRKRIAALLQTGQENVVSVARADQFVSGIEKKQSSCRSSNVQLRTGPESM